MSKDKSALPKGRFRRARKIFGLSARVGSELLSQKFKHRSDSANSESQSENDLNNQLKSAEHILNTLGNMKGAALKLGQNLSMGASHLPPELRKKLSALFSQAPSVEFSEIRQVIESELEQDLHKLFAEFAEEPFAAASLGQVHRARTLDGQDVAVKVQYPGVADSISNDMDNASVLVRVMGLGGKLLDQKQYFEEVKKELNLELDFFREAQNLELMTKFLASEKDLHVPRPVIELSRPKVLVTEFVEGNTLDRVINDDVDLSAEQRFRIGEQLTRAVYRPFFQHGVVHADTHPGNFIVRPDGKLTVLDFGSIKFLSEPFWLCYHESITKILNNEDIDLLDYMRRGGFTVDMEDAKARELINTVFDIVKRPLYEPYDFGRCTMVDELKNIALKNGRDFLRVKPPPEGLLFYRAIGGLTHNLRHLKSSGDFRPTFKKMTKVKHEHWAKFMP